MKKLIAAIIVALPFSVTSVFAVDATVKPQQSKMAACSKANKGLKGEEFKSAPKACLSKDAAPAQIILRACVYNLRRWVTLDWKGACRA